MEQSIKRVEHDIVLKCPLVCEGEQVVRREGV